MSVSEVFLSHLSGPFSSPFIRGPFSHAAASVFNVDALNKFKFYVCVVFLLFACFVLFLMQIMLLNYLRICP